MRGISELIKEHDERLRQNRCDQEFIDLHRSQIKFLQHERIVHLFVMLFTALFTLISLAFFLAFQHFLFLTLFIILLVLTIFYIFHYYKLENTVTGYYFDYNGMVTQQEEKNQHD